MNNLGRTFELYPRSGAMFDSSSGDPSAIDYNESHALDRSIRLPSGTYAFKVQALKGTSNTAFWLSHWHFSVEQYNP